MLVSSRGKLASKERMASFQVGRLVSLPPAASHRSCTHVVLVLVAVIMIMSPLLPSSHAKACKCSSSDQDQRTSIAVNTTLDQTGAYFFLTGSSSLPYNNGSSTSSRYLGRAVPYYYTSYLQDWFNLSDIGYLILPEATQLWEKSDDNEMTLNEASFQVSFSMSINRRSSTSSSNQQKVGNSLVLALLPDTYTTPYVIPPTGSHNASSQPVTIADSLVFVRITCVDTVNITLLYNSTSASSDFDFKSTWIEISTQPPETSSSSSSAFNNYTLWIQYDRDRQLLSVYVSDSGKPKPEKPTVYLASAIRYITTPSTYFGFFSSMEQLHQIYTWNYTVEVLPGNSDGSTGKWSAATIVSVVLGPSVAMGVCVAATIYLYFNSKYRRWKKELDQLAKSMQQLPGVPIQVSFSDIQKATNNFHETMKLGRGGFGAVYRCRLPAPVRGEVLEVAVKKFTRDDNRRYEDFLAEVSVINRLRHKNIVPLIGWSYNKGEPLLIYEYMPNGSLDQHLFRSGNQPQNSHICQWDTRYNIVMDVATGLQYVHHEYEPTVLHRDIKASNIMIDSAFQGRLGDFGLACTVDIGRNSYTDQDPRGTPGFIAHEYLHTGRATRKTDIYAFGVLILEIVTCKPPLGRYGQFGHITDWVWHLHREGKLLDAVDPVVTTEQFDSSDARRLLLLGLACSSPNPSERPSMVEALQVITKLLPPSDVPLEKPRFIWPPEDESSSLSPYLRTANTSLERSSLTILVEMAGRRQVSSENAGSSFHHRPTAMIAGHSQEQEDVSVYHTTHL